MKGKRIEFDKVFRALGDKLRLRILDMLMEREMNAGELLEQVEVVQSTLSHHMRSLCDSGMVIARKEGKWTYYSVSEETAAQARQFLTRYQRAESAMAPDLPEASEPWPLEDQMTEKEREPGGEEEAPEEKAQRNRKTAKKSVAGGEAEAPEEKAQRSRKTAKKSVAGGEAETLAEREPGTEIWADSAAGERGKSLYPNMEKTGKKSKNDRKKADKKKETGKKQAVKSAETDKKKETGKKPESDKKKQKKEDKKEDKKGGKKKNARKQK